MAYLLGWSVIPQMLVRKERWPGGYKTRAIPLVKRGQEVLPDQPALRLEQIAPLEEIVTLPRPSSPSALDSGGGVNYNLGSGMPFPGNRLSSQLVPAGLRGLWLGLLRLCGGSLGLGSPSSFVPLGRRAYRFRDCPPYHPTSKLAGTPAYRR